MSDRRIQDLLDRRHFLTSSQQTQLTQWMEKGFFKTLGSSAQAPDLIDGLKIMRCEPGQVLFRQGEPIETYFLLLKGRVQVTTSLQGATKRVKVVESDQVIGEFFYNTQQNRLYQAAVLPSDDGATIVTVDKEVYYKNYSAQMKKFKEIHEQFCRFFGLSKASVNCGDFYMALDVRIARIGDKLHRMQNHVYLISEGECMMSGRRDSRQVTICKGDCLNLQGYFANDVETKYTYRVLSSQATLYGFSFQLINQLSGSVRSKLAFIHQCHSHNLRVYTPPAQQPRQERATLPYLINEPTRSQRPRQLQHHSLHQSAQASPVKIVRDKKLNESIDNFRKQYSLNYKRAQTPQREKTQSTNLKESKQNMEPRGLFKLPPVRLKKDVPMPKHRDWSKYMLEHSRVKSKENSPDKTTIISPKKSSSHYRKNLQKLQAIFSKYHQENAVSNASVKKLPQKKILLNRQFFFPTLP